MFFITFFRCVLVIFQDAWLSIIKLVVIFLKYLKFMNNKNLIFVIFKKIKFLYNLINNFLIIK